MSVERERGDMKHKRRGRLGGKKVARVREEKIRKKEREREYKISGSN